MSEPFGLHPIADCNVENSSIDTMVVLFHGYGCNAETMKLIVQGGS